MEQSKQVVPHVVLNSGHKMPLIGMGTATVPLPPPEELTGTLVDAIRIGYHHFDTAAIYGTEQPLGKAVAKALEEGLVNSRDDLFITSKLWNTNAHPDLVLPALHTTLQFVFSSISLFSLYLLDRLYLSL